MSVQRIAEFDVLREGYAGAIVTVYVAGTTTKADIFTDEGLTAAANNPQTLDSRTIDGQDFGKFAVPLYTSSAYYLDVDSTDQTGVQRAAIITLDSQDATLAVATANGATASRTLANIFAQQIWAESYGTLTPSGGAATNTTTLTAAIAAANSAGGAIVRVPAGTFPYTTLSIPSGVILEGAGAGATVLQSQEQSNTITFTGARAGLKNLTVDGVSKQAGSVGLYSAAKERLTFENVIVKRFETCIHHRGAKRHFYRNLFLSDGTNGIKVHGDTSSSGSLTEHLQWIGGGVEIMTTVGIELSYEDARVMFCRFGDLDVKNCTGTGLRVNGAQNTLFDNCFFEGNTTLIAVLDDTASPTVATDNDTVGLRFRGGKWEDGAATFRDTCQDIVLQGVDIRDVDFTFTVTVNNIAFIGCTEDSDVTIAGLGYRICRDFETQHGGSSGTTTDATVTKAWGITLDYGELVLLNGYILGNQRNGTGRGHYGVIAAASRAGATLPYDTQTVNFTLGTVVTGSTSGAKGRITADADAGATGTLTLRSVVGTFLDNETITDTSGGSALVNGTVFGGGAVTVHQLTANIVAVETVAGWEATFVANTPEVELQVTGAAATTIEWICAVDVVRNG